MDSLNYSEVESKRFNKEIFRGNIDVLNIDVFKEFYKKNDPDILIVRMPVSEQHKIYQLNDLCKDIINADTLVYYQHDLKNTNYKPLCNIEISFVEGDNSHKGIFEQLISEIFVDYKNHYFSNPVLDKKKITQGYIEWAINTISSFGNLHFLIYAHNNPVGFITCSYNNNDAEIILNGVLPGYQGQGIYTNAIAYVKNYFYAMHVRFIKISTQIQNFAVQKVWNREGFVLSSAYITVHLNKKHL